MVRTTLYERLKEDSELSETEAQELFEEEFKNTLDYTDAKIESSEITETETAEDGSTSEVNTAVFIIKFLMKPDKSLKRLLPCFEDSYAKKEEFLELLKSELGVVDFLSSTVGVGLHTDYKITMKILADKIDLWK